jgi:acetyl esterase/lipase
METGETKTGMLRSARRVLAAASAVALVSLAACSGAATLNALAPTGGVAIRQDVAYRPGARGHLDIYQPTRADGRAPVVVFLYGGGWDSGRKADYRFVGAALARRGFVVMAPDYRVYPQVRWPGFLEDSAQAVAWARRSGAPVRDGPFGGRLQRGDAGGGSPLAGRRWPRPEA